MASTSSQEHSATDSLLQETEEFLQNRIEKTRSEIRRVDLFSMFLALLTVGAGMVFIGILLDHLLFSAGLSLKGRTLYFIFTVIILLVIFASRLRAVLKYRINPLFAAKALEEHKPGLKNALINWYQLRTTAKTGADEKSTFLRQVFLQGVSVQAAREVQTIPQEMVVDHFPVIRWGIALAVLTVLFAGYTLFSAKSVFVSVGRLTLPLANIAPPQSVRFLSVSPGNVQLFQKDSVTVQAEITGVGNSSVWLVFSTLDNRLVDRKIPMQATGGKMYETKFPLSDDGFSESLEYYIAVGIGDSKEIRSDTFTVDVRPEIMFTVEKLTCRYPKYTGLAPQTFNNLGDIHALEGTEVELVGKSNITMKKAFFIPDQDEKLAKIMTIIPDSPDKATYLFSLTSDSTRNSSDVSSNPVYHNYQIRCMDEEGNENRYPVNYRIETVSDVPPIIKWESVQEEDTVTEIPSNQPFSVKVRAEDPDFGLRSVQLHCLPTTSNETGARLLNSQKKTIELLLPVSDRTVHASKTQDSAGTVTADDTPSPYTGQKVLQGIILPEDLGFAIGTEVEYWCEAIDSKFPFPNSTSTDKRLFTVTEPVATPAPLPEDSGNQDHSGEEESADPNSDSRKTDEKENSAAQEKQNQQSDDNQNQEGKQTESDPDNNEQKNSKDSQQKNGRQNSENSANQGAGQQQDRNQNDNPSNQQQQKNQGNSGENRGAKPENPQDTQADNNQKGGGGNNADNSDESTPDSQNQGNDNENQTDNSLSDNQEQSSDTSSSEEGSGGGQADDKESSGQSGANPSPSSGKNNTPEPIDPHANPGDAFETILDYMNQHNESPSAGSGSADSENQINDSTETDQKTDPRESNKNAKQQNSGNQPESSETNEPETEQENQSSATPETPPQNGTPDQRKTEPRSMPETTSNKEADPNAQRYRDDNPDKLESNWKQERNGVDPNTNSFMTQNADPDKQYQDQPMNPDANIVDNPFEKVQGTPTSQPDQKFAGQNHSNPESSGSEPFGPDSTAPDQSESGHEQKNQKSNTPPTRPDSIPENPEYGSPSGSGQNQPAPMNGNQNDSGGSPSGKPGQKKQGETSEKENSENENPSPEKTPQNETERGSGGSESGEYLEREIATLADSPNVQYTEKATTLALSYLEDQLKQSVDKELLDRLGWTEEELRDFLTRWREMKAKAESSGKNSQEEKDYLDALNNIGLRSGPETDGMKSASGITSDKLNSREATRIPPPARFEDRFRVYNKGLSGKKHFSK